MLSFSFKCLNSDRQAVDWPLVNRRFKHVQACFQQVAMIDLEHQHQRLGYI